MTNHKQAAISFLQLCAAGKSREAFEKYVGPGFCHHNPYFKGDAQTLALAMEQDSVKNPNKKFQVLRAMEENDLVAVHSRIERDTEPRQIAVVHISRFQGDRIVELWDLGMPVPENSPNENGMF